MDLDRTSQHCRLLADSTRIRLLLLLEDEELSVAELAAITQLAQPRVSTHLARLREAGLVVDRRDGVSVFYRVVTPGDEPTLALLWQVIRDAADDPMLEQDRQRVAQVLAARYGSGGWADAVAGDMERHYSPGRTWEATARALVRLLDLGDVLDVASGDGVMAELLLDQASSITCLDLSERVVAAGRKRLAEHQKVRFEVGDMHELPVADDSMDTVLMMHALTYTKKPGRVLNEAARVLRPGGRLLAVTLEAHGHAKAVAPFDHINQGFSASQLRSLATRAGLECQVCEVASTEKRPPHFSVITLLAGKPADGTGS